VSYTQAPSEVAQNVDGQFADSAQNVWARRKLAHGSKQYLGVWGVIILDLFCFVKKNLESIIEGCRKQDAKAQRALYELLAPQMLAVCQRYLKDREAAKDVVQDGFVTLFEKISSFRGEGSFEGWARRLFVNTALMQLRRSDALRFSDSIEDSPVMQMTQCTTLEKIRADEIFQLVESMPAGYRTVFNLYVIEGYSHEEIAAMLSISEGGSRAQLSRARAWLQSKIKANDK